MILSRAVSFFLRFAEFVCAAVVLGISAHFIHKHVPPLGRNSFSVSIAALSTLLSVVWLIPSTSAMLHFAGDIILALAWFAAFALDVNWTVYHNHCANSTFNWRGLWRRGQCNEWKAVEAFSFIAGILWLTSAILSLWVGRKVKNSHRATTHSV